MRTLKTLALPVSVCLIVTLAACGGEDTATTTAPTAETTLATADTSTTDDSTTDDTTTDDTTTDDTTTDDTTATDTSAETSPAGDGDVATTTAAVAAAADSFLATLSDDEAAQILYDLGDGALQTGWSNLPIDMVTRNGLGLVDMSEEQQIAALALIEAALSEEGFQEFLDIQAADAYLGENGGGNLTWGAEYYYVAIFGTPSATDTWTLQVGGHHYAQTLTFSGGTVATTPAFTGIEPTSFEADGRTIEPMADEADALFGLLASLDADQLAAAELSGVYDDVLVGPGNDGEFPESDGLLASDLSAEQQTMLVDAAMAWAGDVDEAVAAVVRAQIEASLDETYIGWSSSIDPTEQGAYARIDGAEVWIEMIAQGGIGFGGVHYHSIYRNSVSDYGVA